MNKKNYLHFLISISLFIVIGGFSGQRISLIPEARAQSNNDIKSNKNPELNVTAAFWKQQRNKAMEKRKTPTGVSPKGMIVPKELFGDGVIKQKAKLNEMVTDGYKQPLDFADLAEKRLNGEMFELPMATKTYFLDVGGNANGSEFSSFDFDDGSVLLKPDSPEFLILKKLADNFDGTKYDLNKAEDRKQIRIRLLRMINQRAKPIIEEITTAYYQKFNRPLPLVSLNRSIDYQIELNKVDSNSFLVRGKGSLPPHTSGLAFDIDRQNLTAEEQNFIMTKLAEIERKGTIDALIEYGNKPVFHIFVYFDGKPPKIEKADIKTDN